MFRTFKEKDAIRMGFTYDATVYGVPVWLKEDGPEIVCLPKVYIMRHFLNFADAVYSFAATLFLTLQGSDGEIPLPYSKKRRLTST